MKEKIKFNQFAAPPVIFGRLKDHKKNLKLRPIVPKCTGPTYCLEKVFVPLLKDLLPTTDRTLKSTDDFIERIRATPLPN